MQNWVTNVAMTGRHQENDWLLFYILPTSQIISGRVPTCDSVHLWQLYNTAPLGDQATDTRTLYSTQSHYLYTDLTSHRPILLMSRSRLGNDKDQFDKSLVWFDWDSNYWPAALEACALPIWPMCQVPGKWDHDLVACRFAELVNARLCEVPRLEGMFFFVF